MTQALETRLKALEAKQPKRLRMVFVQQGETREKARARAGVAEDEPVIYLSWIDVEL